MPVTSYGRDVDQESRKLTSFHVTVQDHQTSSRHFLVPRVSEQADNDDVRVTAVTYKTDRDVTQRASRTLYLPDKEAAEDRARRRGGRDGRGGRGGSNMINIGFTTAMRPSGYSESVSVTDGPPVHDKSSATFCNFSVDARYRQAVSIGPTLCPAWYQSRVVCHVTTSKKNFKTSVDYVPKMRPLKYEATQYVRPRHLVTTYVSCVDYTANDSQRWYTTSLQLVPSSNHSNTAHNFQMRQRTGSVSSDGDVEDDVMTSDEDGARQNDINMNILKEAPIRLQRFNPPPLMVSSGPDEDKDGSPSEVRMSHRSKMVVKSAPTQRMNPDDYIVYLNGYASTGDVITNGHTGDGDVDNGYLSGDTTEV